MCTQQFHNNEHEVNDHSMSNYDTIIISKYCSYCVYDTFVKVLGILGQCILLADPVAHIVG